MSFLEILVDNQIEKQCALTCMIEVYRERSELVKIENDRKLIL